MYQRAASAKLHNVPRGQAASGSGDEEKPNSDRLKPADTSARLHRASENTVHQAVPSVHQKVKNKTNFLCCVQLPFCIFM